MHLPRPLSALALLLAVAPCALAAPGWSCAGMAAKPFDEQAESFLLAGLALSPADATQTGYHMHQGRSLDRELGSLSPEALREAHTLLEAGKACFAAPRPGLDPEEQADLQLLRLAIEQELWEADVRHPERYRPEQPVEEIGSALFFPLTQPGGTSPQALENLVTRLEQVPRYLAEARAQLREADPVFLDAAAEESDGAKEAVDAIATHVGTGSPLAVRYKKAAAAANTALDAYAAWLKSDLAARPHTQTWRAGAPDYAQIFRFAVGAPTGETPSSLLHSAEADLDAVRHRMYGEALPLYRQWFPEREQPAAEDDAAINEVVGAVIKRINEDHTTAANLLPTVREQATGITQFIRDKHIVTLSDRGNLRIVETPPFLRASFSVAGFHAPPALEPAGEGEYWVTPLTTGPGAESKLHEYNNWMLQWLTMHEALPGHYLQFEHANGIEPASRRVVRALLGNGPYVEGWAEFGVKQMQDAGYAGGDPRFVLMVDKVRLRAIANTIVDIRMQSMNMTDDELLSLLETKTFQTEAEAEGKLRRAKLTSGQLLTYYVGYRQWNEFYARYQAAAGPAFAQQKFNDEALGEGPLPLPVLEQLMMAKLKR